MSNLLTQINLVNIVMGRKSIVELSEEKQELVDYCKKVMVNVLKYRQGVVLLKAACCRYKKSKYLKQFKFIPLKFNLKHLYIYQINIVLKIL